MIPEQLPSNDPVSFDIDFFNKINSKINLFLDCYFKCKVNKKYFEFDILDFLITGSQTYID